MSNITSILNDWSLEGRNFVVTGGTSGIGLATVKALLAHKAKVVILCSRGSYDSNHPLIQDLYEQYTTTTTTTTTGITTVTNTTQSSDNEQHQSEKQHQQQQIIHIQCDVSTVEGRQKLVNEIQQQYNITALHGLVNTVGCNIRKSFHEQTADEYYTIMRTNIDSAYFVCQLLQPLLRNGTRTLSTPLYKTTTTAVVNVSSAAGVQSSGTGIAYSISKAGMNQLTRTLACEWAGYNIRVNAVTPWMTMTPMLQDAIKTNPSSINKVYDWTPMHRLAQPNEIAAPIVFLLLPCNSYMTGQIIGVDGGLTAQGFDGPCIPQHKDHNNNSNNDDDDDNDDHNHERKKLKTTTESSHE